MTPFHTLLSLDDLTLRSFSDGQILHKSLPDLRIVDHTHMEDNPWDLRSHLLNNDTLNNLLNEQSRVNWVTASVLDSDPFEIQRDADGILFESFIAIPAAGYYRQTYA